MSDPSTKEAPTNQAASLPAIPEVTVPPMPDLPEVTVPKLDPPAGAGEGPAIPEAPPIPPPPAVPPAPRTPATTEPGGRGLQIVEALADDWGVRREGAGKRVWAHVPRHQPV